MDIKTFKVERWINEFEDHCTYNLAETCIDSLTIRELLELCGEDVGAYMLKLADTRLTYSHIYGSPELLEGIAGLYKEVKPEHILPTHGAIGANNMVINTVISAEDNMVCVMPTYQQHYSIPESIGAEVRILNLNLENHFLPDMDQLKSLVDENTKMITINNPNNPSGSIIPLKQMEEIVEVARSVGAYVLCDEVYRGISEDGSYMPSIVDIYEKGISVGSMSKIFSMAGVRLGWIAAREEELIERCKERRDYDTISCGVIDDQLAALALKNKEKVYERNSRILLQNRQILDDWVNATPEVYYQKPEGGTTALVYYRKDMPSYDLCVKLLKSKGVLFTPGECFEMEGAVRIGYAFDSKLLKQGLDLFAEFLKEI
ncbi:MAG: aminotransferase [Anaerotignum sp.]|nr:aminotransferase [Anaerotignum sp.]